MTMIATSHAARGESAPRPRKPAVTDAVTDAVTGAVTDQGGLIAGRTIRHIATGAPPGAWASAGTAAARRATRPDTVLPLSQLAAVIATAGRAPSVHNTQPWKFRIAGGVIDLHSDPGRQLTQLDPAGRELMISCGAALFGLRLGLRQFGCVPTVYLWPDPAQPRLIARAWPDGLAAVNAVEAELLAAVPHRHTHRGPFTPGEVSPRLLAALTVDAAAEGCELRFVEELGLVRELAALVDLAAAEHDASSDISAETRGWLRPAGSKDRDGVPARATADDSETGPLRFRQRDFGPLPEADTAPAGGPGECAGESPSATAVLATATDTPDDWVRAGQALNRLLLRAATRWVFASLQSQPLELPRYRAQVRTVLGLAGQPQMLLQLGRANTALATPRRQQAEFRTNENHA